MKLTKAQTEIDAINREFAFGQYTVDEHASALNGVLSRHGVKTEVIATYPNGIKKIRVTDSNGEIVAEYHQG